MWLPGHLAVSFLLCLPLLVYVKRERLLALFYVAFFALLPDFLHLGPLRVPSHSIIGLTVMLSVALVTLYLLFRPRPILLAIGAVAAVGHLLADLYIGSIYPLYPVSSEWYALHQFNTAFDIRVEIVLSGIALGVLILGFNLRELYRSRRGYTRSMNANLYLLIVAFGAMALLQGAYFAYTMLGNPFDPMRGVLLLLFLVPLVPTGVLLLRLTLPLPD